MSRRIVILAFALALAGALGNLLQQCQSVQTLWSLVALWPDQDAQQRALQDGVPYDLLRATDALLPRDAVLLLVTAGDDARHREYTTFHRALYWLTPRAVWWLSSAPADGTWEARWWIAAPLTVESVRAVANEKRATHVMFVGDAPTFVIGQPIFTSNEGVVYRIDNEASTPSAPLGAERIDAWWPIRLAAALMVVWLLGELVLQWMGCPARSIERIALAWVCGIGAATVGMMWLNAIGLSLAQQMLTLTIIAIGGVVILMTRSSDHRGETL
ncbi:MAG: hypothetical protein ABI874_08430, partial [Chloroflexota bacterium]